MMIIVFMLLLRFYTLSASIWEAVSLLSCLLTIEVAVVYDSFRNKSLVPSLDLKAFRSRI